MSDDPAPQIPSYTGGLSSRQFLAIVCSFWVFATLSDVLWAYGMRTGIARVTDVPLFAEWQSRVLQHLLLLPFLLVSFWASLRVQWRPFWVAAPLQIVLGAVFSTIAYPAMIVSNIVLQGAEWHERVMEHMSSHFYQDSTFLSFWVASFVSFLPAYGFGLALVTGLALYTRFQKSELHVAALELEWSAARLAALRMQLSPHTLFNLLHTIRGHIEWDPKGAQSMVVQLGDLLRRLLNAGERDFSRLTDELQFARLYLELQQRRFCDRLTVVLPEPEHILAVWVPSLILQPLVENAVVHGLAGHQGAVRVRIQVRREHEMLVIRVSNTIAENKLPATAGIGIKNVRERLAVQFAGRASLTAGAHGAEWISEIRIPEIFDSPDRQAARRIAPLVGA
jgi:signal transduction histidine kinase